MKITASVDMCSIVQSLFCAYIDGTLRNATLSPAGNAIQPTISLIRGNTWVNISLIRGNTYISIILIGNYVAQYELSYCGKSRSDFENLLCYRA